MPLRIQISLTPEQHRRVRARCAALGISLAEYIRRLVEADLGGRPPRPGVSRVFDLGDSGGSDMASEKDHMLGAALEADGAALIPSGRQPPNLIQAGNRSAAGPSQPLPEPQARPAPPIAAAHGAGLVPFGWVSTDPIRSDMSTLPDDSGRIGYDAGHVR